MYTHVNIFTKLHLPTAMARKLHVMHVVQTYSWSTFRKQKFDSWGLETHDPSGATIRWYCLPPVSTDFHDATTDVQHRAHVFTVETCWQRSSSQPHGARLWSEFTHPGENMWLVGPADLETSETDKVNAADMWARLATLMINYHIGIDARTKNNMFFWGFFKTHPWDSSSCLTGTYRDPPFGKEGRYG